MLYESTLETFEEASLRVQKTLTSLKELTYRKNMYTRDAMRELNSSTRNSAEMRDRLLKMYEIEKEIENEFKELVVFLDIQSEDVQEDVSSFREMVFKAAIKNKLENISYFINTEIYEREANEDSKDSEYNRSI